MKKHIFGLAIFSFIVSTAAIVYSFVSVLEINPDSVVVPQSNLASKATACWNRKRKSEKTNVDTPTIKQAVYNVKTKMFRWRLTDPEANSSTRLHFFIGDEKGIRHIFSLASQSSEVDGQLNFSPGDATLDKISGHQANLFIIADADVVSSFSDNDYKTREAKFDASKAVSATIDYGN